MAQAAQISTPAIYGALALAQDRTHCTVVNGGTTNVAVALKLVNEFGVTQGTYNCGSMAPGSFCALGRAIDNTAAHACSATAGNVSNLRGSLVIEEYVWDAVWWTYFLRPIRSAPMR